MEGKIREKIRVIGVKKVELLMGKKRIVEKEEVDGEEGKSIEKNNWNIEERKELRIGEDDEVLNKDEERERIVIERIVGKDNEGKKIMREFERNDMRELMKRKIREEEMEGEMGIVEKVFKERDEWKNVDIMKECEFGKKGSGDGDEEFEKKSEWIEGLRIDNENRKGEGDVCGEIEILWEGIEKIKLEVMKSKVGVGIEKIMDDR